MICPLLLIADCTLQDTNEIDTRCRKEDCAWWEDMAGKCAIKSLGAIAINLREIANSLDNENPQ